MKREVDEKIESEGDVYFFPENGKIEAVSIKANSLEEAIEKYNSLNKKI